jgi:hypothetical protein
VNSPVADDDGELAYIIHRIEDVTEFIRLKQHDSEYARRAEALQDRAQEMEAEIFQHAQELQESTDSCAPRTPRRAKMDLMLC